jgi:CBS domain-containing protein
MNEVRWNGQRAADVMLREPKTLPGAASVADVRAQLANPKVQLVLLADGSSFVGAITAIPDGARDDEQASAYSEQAPETIAPDAPAEVAFDRALANPHRRVIVLGDEGELLGLLCLNSRRTQFCQTG